MGGRRRERGKNQEKWHLKNKLKYFVIVEVSWMTMSIIPVPVDSNEKQTKMQKEQKYVPTGFPPYPTLGNNP